MHEGDLLRELARRRDDEDAGFLLSRALEFAQHWGRRNAAVLPVPVLARGDEVSRP